MAGLDPATPGGTVPLQQCPIRHGRAWLGHPRRHRAAAALPPIRHGRAWPGHPHRHRAARMAGSTAGH